MLTKISELRRAKSVSLRFWRDFRKESHPLNLYMQQKSYAGSPLFKIYVDSCETALRELAMRGVGVDELFLEDAERVNDLSPHQIEAIRNIAERNVADQALRLEHNVGFLANAVSMSPFLGLLGTVWGVMEAFTSMASSGSANLSAVAPGISAALLTTVVGLLVALPSAFGYNIITNHIRTLTVQMDNFAQELAASVQHKMMNHD